MYIVTRPIYVCIKQKIKKNSFKLDQIWEKENIGKKLTDAVIHKIEALAKEIVK